MQIDDKLKIKAFEKDRRDFETHGIDILKFVRRKLIENPDMKLDFYDFAGEYYLKPEHFYIGEDKVYKKKQFAGEVPAEVILAYAYNYLGIPSPIAYPYFMSQYFHFNKSNYIIPDGIISKDIKQVFPTATHRRDNECHTIHGLYTSEKCDNITRQGKLSRIKETIASIAFNNKDAGYLNSYWLRDENTGKYTSIVSIDHGYSGRDSMYGKDKDSVMAGLYHIGEHGYNGMYKVEEDRKTTLYFLKKLLAGNRVDGVQFTDDEINELISFIQHIGNLNFRKIAYDYAQRYKYICSPSYMQSLEWSREDLCQNLS